MGTEYKEGQKMSLKSKVSILMCLLLAVSICISAQAPTAHSWAWDTHYFIETNAELVFSAGSFFSGYHSTLQTWCVMPDSDPSFMPDGGGASDWHYLDGVTYHPLVYTGGKLPWAMEWIFDNIVQYLEDEDWTTAVHLLGAICHFTGDATMPLHSTWDYWIGGMHTTYEHEVNDHLYTGEITIPISDYVPQELDNICQAALVTLEESFDFTDEDPNGGPNLSDFLEVGISWNDWIKSMTENRVRASVQFTANVWYTAMIHAGLTIQAPTLTSPSDGSTTTDSAPTFAWASVGGTNFYDFQLASDNGFTSGVVTVKSLSTTSYTLENSLSGGSWYWRVRTGDNSTDVGLWSQTQCFTVSTSHEVSISPSYQSGQPGENLDYIVTVVNFGNVEDNYDLTVSDNAGWTIKLSDNLLENVPAGENRAATLRVTIPADAENYTVDNITITAASQENSQISANASCIAHAGFTTEEFTLRLVAGWNLVGFPVTNENMTPANLFAGATYTMYYWTAPGGPYIEPTYTLPVEDNRGYWVRENQDTIITFSGTREGSRTMDFVAGWNLVSFPNTSASTTPANLFAGTTFGMYYWNAPFGPYKAPDKTKPVEDNRGYWVKLNQDKTVTVPL